MDTNIPSFAPPSYAASGPAASPLVPAMGHQPLQSPLSMGQPMPQPITQPITQPISHPISMDYPMANIWAQLTQPSPQPTGTPFAYTNPGYTHQNPTVGYIQYPGF